MRTVPISKNSADGTANITGTVFNPLAPQRIWHIDMWLENKADYDAWVSQLTISAPFINRQPKDFLNLASQEDKESWEYYEVDATRSKLTVTVSSLEIH